MEPKKLTLKIIGDLDFKIKAFMIDMKHSTKELVKGTASVESKGVIVNCSISYESQTNNFNVSDGEIEFLDGSKAFVFADDLDKPIPYEKLSFNPHQFLFSQKLFGSSLKKSEWIEEVINTIKKYLLVS